MAIKALTLRVKRNTGNTLAITSLTAEALNSTTAQGTISTTAPGNYTMYLRFKSTAGAPAATPANFPIQFQQSGGISGFTFLDGSNFGGSLSPSTQYTVYGYLDDGVTTTSVFTGSTFTTPDASENVAPSNIRWTTGGTSITVSESTPVGTVIGFVTADGTPTPTFTETTDPDAKFTISAVGAVTLSAALDFSVDTSHSYTVTAANGESPNASQALTINVSEAVAPSEPTANATVASFTAAKALIDTWSLSGDVRQVPGGAPYVIDVTGPVTGNQTFNYKFNHLVTIRGKGTFTQSYASKTPTISASSTINGSLTCTGGQNFRIDRFFFNGGNASMTSCTDCEFYRCASRSSFVPLVDQVTATTGTGDGFVLDNGCVGCKVTYCYAISGDQAGFVLNNVTTDCEIRGTLMDHARHDHIKLRGNTSPSVHLRPNVSGNFACRTWVTSSTGPHTDFIQMQTETGAQDAVFEDNVALWGERYVVGVGDPLQAYFNGDKTRHTRPIYRRNVVCGNTTNGIYFGVLTGTPIVRNCDVIPQDFWGDLRASQDTREPRVLTSGDLDFNFVMHSVESDSAKAGASGVAQLIPNMKTSTIDLTAEFVTTGEFTRVPSVSDDLSALMPPNSSARRHWDNANPVGAWQLLKAISEGNHPGNIGWPVSEPWERQYNFRGNITSNYNGAVSFTGNDWGNWRVCTSTNATYDEYGNIVV